MAVNTFCHACCRIIRVPESSVGRSVRCSCGQSFRVETPLAQRLEEERQREYLRRGKAFLDRYEERGIGRPTFQKRPLGLGTAAALILLCTGLYLEQTLLRPPPRRSPPTYEIRMLFAYSELEMEDPGTSPRDPIRPALPVGMERPSEVPGADEHPVMRDVAEASTPDSPESREGSPERGRWRMVPEEASKLWELEGVDDDPREGHRDPDDVEGVGLPLEGAPARPSDPREEEREKAKGRVGTNPEMEALERLSRESTGGGIRFFGSPISLPGEGVVFVLDRSASMILRVAPPVDAPVTRRSWTKLDLAIWELKKAIAMLPEGKKFNVIFFDDCLERWHYQVQPATSSRKWDAYAWLDTVKAQGQSNVSEAVVAALEEPGVNTIVLLTDGMPNVINCRSMVEARPWVHREKIRQSNQENEPIWCFSYSEDPDSEAFLRQLAKESNGRFTAVCAKPF